MKVTSDLKRTSAEEFVKENIAAGSKIKTDKFKSFEFLEKKGFKHISIKIYNPKQTLKYLPWVHIMIGNVKGLLKGVHHGVSPKHLQRYLSGFSYKFNRRFIEKTIFTNLVMACCSIRAVTLAELRA